MLLRHVLSLVLNNEMNRSSLQGVRGPDGPLGFVGPRGPEGFPVCNLICFLH